VSTLQEECTPGENEPSLAILVADDSAADRELIVRALDEWRGAPARAAVRAVGRAEDALAAIRAESFALILLDYDLPGLDGLALLQRLRTAGIRTPIVAPSVTVGPSVTTTVVAVPSGTGDYRPTAGVPSPAAGRAESVPPFPPKLAQIVGLVDDADTETLVQVVALEASLAARTIRMASGAGHGRSRSPSTLRDAVIVLGSRRVRNLAVTEFTRSLFARWDVADEFLWEQSLRTAAGAQLVLETCDPKAADDAYLCGLLHNVGGVALNNRDPEGYEAVLRAVIAEGSTVADVERGHFGRDADTLTRDLTAGWPLPPSVRRALEGRSGTMSAALRWARVVALTTNPAWLTLRGEQPEPAWITDEVARAGGALALAPEALEALAARIEERCQALCAVMA
jgi:HD-like signal output (HDOD) protein